MVTVRGPLSNIKKNSETIVNPDVDVYNESRNHRKTLGKTSEKCKITTT